MVGVNNKTERKVIDFISHRRQSIYLSTCDGPNNSEYDQRYIGVIWLGEAANIPTQNRFKSGIHRVVYPRIPHQARLTIWQEACTEGQIKQLFEKDNNAQRLPSGAEVMLANQPNSKPMSVLPGGENSLAFMKRVESQRGLSMSKSRRSYISVQPESIDQTNAGPSFHKNKKATSNRNNSNIIKKKYDN